MVKVTAKENNPKRAMSKWRLSHMKGRLAEKLLTNSRGMEYNGKALCFLSSGRRREEASG